MKSPRLALLIAIFLPAAANALPGNEVRWPFAVAPGVEGLAVPLEVDSAQPLLAALSLHAPSELELHLSTRVTFRLATYHAVALVDELQLTSGSCTLAANAAMPLADNQEVTLTRQGDCVPADDALWTLRVKTRSSVKLAVWAETTKEPPHGCVDLPARNVCVQGYLYRPIDRNPSSTVVSRILAHSPASLFLGWFAICIGIVAIIVKRRPETSLRRLVTGLGLTSFVALTLYWGLWGAYSVELRYEQLASPAAQIYYRTRGQAEFPGQQRRVLALGENVATALVPSTATVLRLDPGEAPGQIRLSSLRIASITDEVVFSPRDLFAITSPIHQTNNFQRSVTELSFTSIGTDPHVAFSVPAWPPVRLPVWLLLLAAMLSLAHAATSALLGRLLASPLATATGWFAEPSRLVLVVGLPAMAAFALLTPPFLIPDEPTHLMRVQQVLEGQLIPEVRDGLVGGEFEWPTPDPSAAFTQMAFYPHIRTTKQHTLDELKKSPRLLRGFRVIPASMYSPIAYLLHLPGAALASAMEPNRLYMLYGARLSSGLFYLLICYLAIRLLPAGKTFAAAVVLLPMSLAEAAGVSADATVTAAALLFVACIAKILSMNQPPTRTLMAIALLAAAALGLSKGIYGLLSLGGLALLRREDRRGTLLGIGCLVLGVASALLWSRLTYAKALSTHTPSSVGQMLYGVSEPFSMFSVLIHTLWLQAMFLIQGFIGILGWLDTYLPVPVYCGFTLLLFLARPELEPSPAPRKLLFPIASSGVLSLVILAMYAANTGIGGLHSIGVQGRYFIPLVFCFLPLARAGAPEGNRVVAIGTSIFLVWSLQAMSVRFYGEG